MQKNENQNSRHTKQMRWKFFFHFSCRPRCLVSGKFEKKFVQRFIAELQAFKVKNRDTFFNQDVQTKIQKATAQQPKLISKIQILFHVPHHVGYK
jgi:hypothetical protein